MNLFQPITIWSRMAEVRSQVKLYQKDDLQEFYLPVSLKAEDRTITAEGMQTWRGSYQIPADVYIVNAGSGSC